MPWQTQELQKLVLTAKNLVVKTFQLLISDLKTQVFIAQKDELQNAILAELKELKYSQKAISKIKTYFLPYVIGKFFKLTNEIWVLHGKGDNVDTIVHEFLHSIQKCETNREGIVDYLTYRMTGNQQYLDVYELVDWQELEKSVSLKKIKEKLISIGDCQDF
jgi:hypothetical protein